MKMIVKYFAKKYVVSIINDSLQQMKQNESVEKCKVKIVNIIKFLNMLADTLDDNTIDDDEIEKVLKEAKELF